MVFSQPCDRLALSRRPPCHGETPPNAPHRATHPHRAVNRPRARERTRDDRRAPRCTTSPRRAHSAGPPRRLPPESPHRPGGPHRRSGAPHAARPPAQWLDLRRAGVPPPRLGELPDVLPREWLRAGAPEDRAGGEGPARAAADARHRQCALRHECRRPDGGDGLPHAHRQHAGARGGPAPDRFDAAARWRPRAAAPPASGEHLAGFTAYRRHLKRAKRRAIAIQHLAPQATGPRRAAYRELLALTQATADCPSYALAHVEGLPPRGPSAGCTTRSRRCSRASSRRSPKPRAACCTAKSCLPRRSSSRSSRRTDVIVKDRRDTYYGHNIFLTGGAVAQAVEPEGEE